MKRGEVWSVAGGADYAGKPRPVVILQDDRFSGTLSITIRVSSGPVIGIENRGFQREDYDMPRSTDPRATFPGSGAVHRAAASFPDRGVHGAEVRFTAACWTVGARA